MVMAVASAVGVLLVVLVSVTSAVPLVESAGEMAGVVVVVVPVPVVSAASSDEVVQRLLVRLLALAYFCFVKDL